MLPRKYTRYPTDIPIKFSAGIMIGEHQVCLKDAARGGLCLMGAGWIEPGTFIDICIPFSDEPCKTSGKIVWCSHGKKGRYLMGIEFNETLKQSAIEEIYLIEQYKDKLRADKGIKMTSGEAARALGAIIQP